MQVVNKKLSDSFSSPAKPPVSEENIEGKPGIPKSDPVTSPRCSARVREYRVCFKCRFPGFIVRTWLSQDLRHAFPSLRVVFVALACLCVSFAVSCVGPVCPGVSEFVCRVSEIVSDVSGIVSGVPGFAVSHAASSRVSRGLGAMSPLIQV